MSSNRHLYERRRDWITSLKQGPCTDCGGKFPPECMQFDHVHGEKLFTISEIKGKARTLAEIAKCELVCANCHAIRTKQRYNMSARRNPTMSKSAAHLEPPIRGIDNLENPIGVNMKALEDSEKMPEVSMEKHDGDQRDVASPAFAVGKDGRHFEGGPSGSDPTPAMPGA